MCVSYQSSDDEEGLGKNRRHILVNKNEMPGWSDTLESFRTARESWDLLHSHDSLETGKKIIYLYHLDVLSQYHKVVTISTILNAVVFKAT